MVLGIIRIGADEVGILEKKFGDRLPPGQLIALHGEAGYQADIIRPGYDFKLELIYEVHRVPVVKIPNGEIGLVIAQDGRPLQSGQRLARVVDCDDFQDARAFLENGGQKGQQLGILKPGTHPINTKLFTVITSANAVEHGMTPEQLKVCSLEKGKIGIITTKDGQPLPVGEIAGKIIEGHDNFQNPQKFLDKGGYKGLQEEYLPGGTDYYINPWFAEVEEMSLTNVPTGTVGVIVAHVGKNLSIPSTEPVPEGYKGICKNPLYPNLHPINGKVFDVFIIPTHQITLVWSGKEKPQGMYDYTLEPIKLRSQDGFAFNIEVTQLMSIKGEDAPKVLSRIGSPDGWTTEKDENDNKIEADLRRFISIKYFVARILESMVNNYLRQAAQAMTVLDFHSKRDEIQNALEDKIKAALKQYYVQADNTLINEIDLPQELESLLTETNTIDARIRLEKKRTELEYQRQLTNSQADRIRFELEQDQEVFKLRIEERREERRLQIIGRELDLMGGFHNWIIWKKVEQLPQIKLPNFLVNSTGTSAGMLEAIIEPMLPSINSTAFLEESNNYPQLESSPPRCPVIMILDTSATLTPDYLSQFRKVLEKFQQSLAASESANRSIEITTITFGGTAQIVQNTVTEREFSLPNLQLQGSSQLGQGLEKALKMLESTKNRYKTSNLQYLTPWVFLLLGSKPEDNWQNVAQKIQQAVGQKQFNLLAVGIEGVNEKLLGQITPNYLILQNLKFTAFFFWFANQVKGMPKTYLLSQFALAVASVQKSMPEQKAKILEEKMDHLISEAGKPHPDRTIYSPLVADILKIAREIGDNGQILQEILPLITQSLEFS